MTYQNELQNTLCVVAKKIVRQQNVAAPNYAEADKSLTSNRSDDTNWGQRPCQEYPMWQTVVLD